MDKIDDKRRQFLKGSVAAFGAVGVAGMATPFLSYLSPSEGTQAAGAPVTVDLKSMKPGEQKTVLWRGKPVWIIKRTEAMLMSLKKATPLLSDPNSEVPQQPSFAQNEIRSRRPEYLVLLGVCTHLGCAPTFRPEPGAIDANWPGGFYCACHGSRFDLSGRVFKNVPAPINLEVPDYYFLDDQTLVVGQNTPEPASA